MGLHLYLSLHIKTYGPRRLKTEITANIPSVNLSREKDNLVIKAARIEGDIQIDSDRISASLKQMNLDYPKLNVAGNLTLAHNVPRASLHLEGRRLDAESIREVTLQLAGHVRTVRRIFKWIKGGSVPNITLKIEGKSLSDFKNKKNIYIQGRMVDGKIYIPKADLDLEEVNGDAVIAGGILEGQNLMARYGNSRGRDGTLRVGLKRKPAPLNLDIGITADVTQIPPVLKRLAKNQTFREELDRIKNLRGKATGRLWLGENTAKIKVRVDVSEFELAGNYGRIPYPLVIRGGRFSYKNKQVEVENLKGKLGQSTFSQFSAGLNWEIEPDLTVTSANYEVQMEEIFPWLVAAENLPFKWGNIRTIDGVVAISSLNVKGPWLKPRKWELAATGEIRNISLNTSLLPGPAVVTSGQFRQVQNSNDQMFSFSGARVALLGSEFNMRGDFKDYLDGLQNTDLSVDGDMGSEITQWLTQLIGLPDEFYPRTPLAVSYGRLVWEKGDKTSFTGDLVAKNNTRVSIKATRNPSELNINKLLIQDADSHASIQLEFKNGECGLDFIGHLNKTTLDNLLAKNPIVAGQVRGDFHSKFVIDHPVRSSSHGKLEGQGIVLLMNPDELLKIDILSLNAAGNTLKVDSAVITWDDIHMILGGDVSISEKDLFFDLDLSASSLDWIQVRKFLDKKENDNNKIFDLPIRGTLRLKSESFGFKKYTWSPILADIYFDSDEINIDIRQASLCSISTPGLLKINSQGAHLELLPGAVGQQLDATLTCLFNRSHQIDGKFNFGGHISGRGKTGELTRSLSGKLNLKARNGRIYHSPVLARILAYINITEIFSSTFTDLEKEGFGYKKIKIKTKIKKGEVQFREISMDGNTLTLTGKGTLDLNDNTLDLTLLVAPLKTVDRLIDKVPLVGDIIGDFISIPFGVKGDLTDPKVVPLSASAIGADLKGIMQKTLKLPFKIFSTHPP